MKVSRDFLIGLKLNDRPAYQIAQEAGVNPNTLSKLINGIEPIHLDDERILKVARVLGIAAVDAFSS